MLREIVHINEELCNGCGDCVPACHEGALQIIDNKARLVSDLMCDGLGACLGHCPQGAITIEKREAQPYNEVEVMKLMVEKGENTVVAHLQHLKDHQEFEFLKEGVQFLKSNESNIRFDIDKVMQRVHNSEKHEAHEHIKPMHHAHSGGGCPGSQAMSFAPQGITLEEESVSGKSELRQWPVQMHLINPQASYFQNSDLLVAADCVAFSLGNFHQKWLKDKTVAIACPKLDSGMEVYLSKLTSLVDDAKINTMTVMIMQVPCCGGLLQMVQTAVQNASRKVPVKAVVVGIQGEILQEEWV
ncbi:MAG: 4Fe-4S ferredoxin [Marinilabiliales bacterium]|nr:MAG: 4Fe-4S ferredoxin [Marinilabiliales bacterium]